MSNLPEIQSIASNKYQLMRNGNAVLCSQGSEGRCRQLVLFIVECNAKFVTALQFFMLLSVQEQVIVK